MLFMIAAILKDGAEAELIKHHDAFNEHIGPSAENVRVAGVLRKADGKRQGYVAFYEGEGIEEARKWLEESPLYQAHLYEHIDLYEYQVEIGQLG